MRHPVSIVERLSGLPAGDRSLLKSLVGFALLALLVGIFFGAMTALVRSGAIAPGPEHGYRAMTMHGVIVFFYWLYFAQAALLLVLAFVFTEGATRIAGGGAAWAGLVCLGLGFAAALVGIIGGPPLLYDGSPETALEDPAGTQLFYLGYLLLAVGVFLVAAAAVATALAPRFAGRGGAWPAIVFGAVAWAGLLMVSAVGALNTFLPAALWSLGLSPLPADHATAWHILFHNMHYLPLMGVVLVWYALVRDALGGGSIFGERFSKIVFASYLVFVPPTSLYHMFLEPGLAPAVRAIGSLLSLFISVPTVAAFLVIVISIEAHARARGLGGLFGWLRVLPWRDPAIAAVGAAAIALALGGTFSFVLIQEKLAGLLSDTFFVPGYFHLLTVGTVSLTLLAGLMRIIPPITGGAIPARRLLVALPILVVLAVAVFAGAGILAGMSGMPRRVLDATYDGAAPAAWATWSAVIGVAGAAMALGLALYAGLLGKALVAPDVATAQPTAAPPPPADAEAPMRPAWTAPAAVAVLVVAMYGATAVAFTLMNGLPITATGGGH